MHPILNSKKLVPFIVAFSMIAALFPNWVAKAQTSTLTLTPVADTYISQSSTSTNYGSSTSIRVDGSPEVRGYLRFDVKGLNGGTITNAKLQVYGNSSNTAGVSAARVTDNSWAEKSISFINAPAVGTAINKSGPVSSGKWAEVDVTPYIKGEGLYSIALAGLNTTAINLASRESGANSPKIYLTIVFNSQTPTPPPPPPSDPPTPGTPLPLGVSGTWNLRFSDEFNSGRLDLSKWEPNWLAGNDTAITKPVNGNEQSCYDPKQVSVGAYGGAAGALKLSAVARSCTANNGTTYKYASGIVTSNGHYNFKYGYMEARVWLAGSSSTANWPAFWSDGMGTWPTTGEIDVMEGLGGSPAWHYHYGTASSPQQVGGTPSMSSKVGWHVFGANWQPGSIDFYYDGKLVGHTGQSITSSNQFIILDYAVSSNISGPITVPSDFLVDYVRVWQH